MPVANAKVSLNNRTDLSSQTAPSGNFSIFNVPDGNYTLSAEKTNSDSSFLATTSYVTVTKDVTLDPLILPKGVKMYSLSNPTSKSLTISWNPTNATDFREYKLYRHTTSGLDETTGTLAHVATTISDTQYVDNNLNPLTEYYYRVYVMNEYGHLGGSNIISASTLNINIVTNGSFENSTSSVPNNWTTWGTSGKFSSDNATAEDGIKSLKVQLALSDWGVNSWGIYQQIIPTNFEQGKTYQVSFWCKIDTLEQYESMSCHFASSMNYGSSSLVDLYNFIEGPSIADDWTQYSFTFTAPSTVPANYYLIYDLVRAGTSGYTFHLQMTAWLDNIVIQKLP